ncbi:formylglycine-generating enzyme family protein [Candidatus Poribacteria bacterium]
MRNNTLSKIALCVLSVVLCFSAIAADTGSLNILCKPGIQIYLDGELSGITTSEEEGGLLLESIAVGEHKIRGGESIPQEFGVLIRAGETRKIRLGKDGAPMVLIPAGEFQMGTDPAEIPELVQQSGGNAPWFEHETPRHTVYVDAFYMDVYEVTNAQYEAFIDATGHSAPGFWHDTRYNAPEQPVVGVRNHDAVIFARLAGKRLPTEAEWEKAARGGLVGKRYPWGDDVSHDDANYSGTGGKDVWSSTSPVGSFAPNGYGLYDMGGNVWEWCADWYFSLYYASSPPNNPLGPMVPNSGLSRVLRGGCWHSSPNILRVAIREKAHPTETTNHIGFRCVSQD